MKTLRRIFVAGILFFFGLTSVKAQRTELENDAIYLRCTFSVQLQSTPLKKINASLPRPAKQTLPNFPMDMRLRGESGYANLRLRIGKDGKIDNVTVSGATNIAFEAAAREAVRGWKFLPAQENGQPVAVEMDYNFEFHLVIPE